jgi:archaellum component FlaC
VTCRCRSGECDPECDGPELRAEIERQKNNANLWHHEYEVAKAEVERLTADVELLGREILKLRSELAAARAAVEWP